MPLSVGLVEGWERCGDWATKVCCWVERFADGAAGVTNGCRKGLKLAGSG